MRLSKRAAANRLALGMSADFTAGLINLPGRLDYPLATFDFLLVHRDLRQLPNADLLTRQTVKDFILWSLGRYGGQRLAGSAALGNWQPLNHCCVTTPPEYLTAALLLARSIKV